MNKENIKFRYYFGEAQCPEEKDPFKSGPFILRTFWELEKYVSKAYGADGIIAMYDQLSASPNGYFNDYVKSFAVPEEEKAVFLTCAQAVDTYDREIDPEVVDAYFSHGTPHTIDLQKGHLPKAQ